MVNQDVSEADYDESPLLIKVSVVMPILSVAIVALRVWSRKIGRTRLGVDDWLVIVAQACSFGIPIAAVLSALHGVGKHIEVVEAEDPNNMQWVMGILFVGELAYISLIALIKVSILQLYLHVFPTPYMKKGVVGIYILLALWTTACIILTIFQCTPINAAWDKAMVRAGQGHCVDQGAYFIGVAVPHTATDVAILALPLFELRKLQMPKWKKWAISGIFLLGGFIVIVSIVRLTTLIAMYNAGEDADTTVLLMPVELWTVTEVSVAIICACLPTLGPLVARFGPAALHLLSTQRKDKRSDYLYASGSSGGGNGRTPDGSAAAGLRGSENAARRHHRFSATVAAAAATGRGHNFQRLEGDSFCTSTFASHNDGDGDAGGEGGVHGYYPQIVPVGYAAEQDVEIFSPGQHGNSSGGGKSAAETRVGTRKVMQVLEDEGGGEPGEIPLQGIHVKQYMTWAETSSERS